jgi:predicted RNA binding protein YcfA (HicA-like mRNA interferase family)
MRQLPALKPQEVIRALEHAGFFVQRISGSHHVLRHESNPALRVTVAYHHKDLKPKTIRSIIKQAGLSVDEFVELL